MNKIKIVLKDSEAIEYLNFKRSQKQEKTEVVKLEHTVGAKIIKEIEALNIKGIDFVDVSELVKLVNFCKDIKSGRPVNQVATGRIGYKFIFEEGTESNGLIA